MTDRLRPLIKPDGRICIGFFLSQLPSWDVTMGMDHCRAISRGRMGDRLIITPRVKLGVILCVYTLSLDLRNLNIVIKQPV